MNHHDSILSTPSSAAHNLPSLPSAAQVAYKLYGESFKNYKWWKKAAEVSSACAGFAPTPSPTEAPTEAPTETWQRLVPGNGDGGSAGGGDAAAPGKATPTPAPTGGGVTLHMTASLIGLTPSMVGAAQRGRLRSALAAALGMHSRDIALGQDSTAVFATIGR